MILPDGRLDAEGRGRVCTHIDFKAENRDHDSRVCGGVCVSIQTSSRPDFKCCYTRRSDKRQQDDDASCMQSFATNKIQKSFPLVMHVMSQADIKH